MCGPKISLGQKSSLSKHTVFHLSSSHARTVLLRWVNFQCRGALGLLLQPHDWLNSTTGGPVNPYGWGAAWASDWLRTIVRRVNPSGRQNVDTPAPILLHVQCTTDMLFPRDWIPRRALRRTWWWLHECAQRQEGAVFPQRRRRGGTDFQLSCNLEALTAFLFFEDIALIILILIWTLTTSGRRVTPSVRVHLFHL